MDISKNRRKKYLIKKKFQIKLILYFELLVIIGNIISGILIYSLTSSELESKFFRAYIINDNAWNVMKPLIITSQFYVFIFMTIATVFLVLYSSNRIAGPLHRIEKVSNEIGSGNLMQTLEIRKGDELQRLLISFQHMIDNFRNKFLEFQNNLTEIKKIEPLLQDAIITSSLSENEKNVLSKAVKDCIIRYQESLNIITFSEQ